MSTALKNLSEFDPAGLPKGQRFRIGIAVSEWNHEITSALLEGAKQVLRKAGVKASHISIIHVPGSFELPSAARQLAKRFKPDAVICLGCVIQGETRHFDFICQAVAHGLTQLNITFDIPFIFGVLTPQTLQQAKDRAGGKHGNKGVEAAVTALKMAELKRKL